MPSSLDPPLVRIKSRFLLRACMAELENSDKIEDCLRLLIYKSIRIATIQSDSIPVSVVVTHECYEQTIDRWISMFDFGEEYMRVASRLSFSYHPTDESAIDWATRHVCEYHSAILITKEFDLPF